MDECLVSYARVRYKKVLCTLGNFFHMALGICKTLFTCRRILVGCQSYIDESVERRVVSLLLHYRRLSCLLVSEICPRAPHAKKSLHDRILSVVRVMYQCFRLVCTRDPSNLAPVDISLGSTITVASAYLPDSSSGDEGCQWLSPISA